ncbi:MAG: enhanced serine sensitivity protein SseB C-terminal domain-containing protein [Ruminiclostridium sp.]|nr:enhanced serine sensitivity protein SseB C-terminal domain-containing protein [Ruminiclostridium sp.]
MAGIDMDLLKKKVMAIKNPELLAAMREIKASEKPEEGVQKKYVNAIMKASFVVPVAIKSVDADGKLKMDISHLKNKQGDAYIMAFTDYDTLLKAAKGASTEPQALGFTYGDLVRMVSEKGCPMKGFAINPFTENIIIGPQQAHAISMLSIQMKVESGEMAVINELPTIPFEITAPIEKYFDKVKTVRKAYLMSLKRADEERRLVIVDLFEGVDFAEFSKAFAEDVLKPMDDEKMPFMVMPITEEAAAISVKEKVPFYVAM